MSTEPRFTALATSTRHLHNLLRCIAFSPQAKVQISAEGLRFTTDEVHAVQASTLLDKALFSSYLFSSDSEDSTVIPPFQVNVIALLETLQIFGISESSSSTHRNQNGGISSSYAAAFHTPALGLGGTCKITYAQVGAPLSITIEESGVKTTCEMNTYSLPHMYEDDDEIPLDRDALVMKMIMPSAWLHDAISELASTSTETLVVNASSHSTPYLALEGHGGPFGDSTVDFAPEPRPDDANTNKRRQPTVTETFIVAPADRSGRIKQRYKFDMIKKAVRAMQMASKVSVRMDRQGVLSLQFMIEGADTPGSTVAAGPGVITGGVGNAAFSFVDYRFVPLADLSDDEGEQTDESNEDQDYEDEEDEGDSMRE